MDTSSSKSFQLVSLVGYLIGIPKEVFDREELNDSVFDSLEDKPEAKVIRCLCSLRNSLLKEIKVDRLADSMDHELAYDFVIKLIHFSKRDFALRNCEESKSFLLNKNQMLEWYIECIPGIDCERFLQDMRNWVEENTSPNRKIAT